MSPLRIVLILTLASTLPAADTGAGTAALLTQEATGGDFQALGLKLAQLEKDVRQKLGSAYNNDVLKAAFRNSTPKFKSTTLASFQADAEAFGKDYDAGNWMAAFNDVHALQVGSFVLERKADPNVIYKWTKTRAEAPNASWLDLQMAAWRGYKAGAYQEALSYIDREIAAVRKMIDPKEASANQMWGIFLNHAYTVQGMIYAAQDRYGEAAQSLAQSIATPYVDPTVVGPSMMLAQALIATEPAAVLSYLEKCKVVWPSGAAKLSEWIAAIQAGQAPKFGSAAFVR